MDAETKETLKKIEGHLKALVYFQGVKLNTEFLKDIAKELNAEFETSDYKPTEQFNQFMEKAYKREPYSSS